MTQIKAVAEKITIKLLCPGRKCRKCKRLIANAEEAVNRSDADVDIRIVDSLNEMLKYRTWILPALIINEKILVRGYVPTVEFIMQHLDEA